MLAVGTQAENADRTTLWFLVGQTGPDDPVKTIPVASFPFTVGRHPGRSLCLAYPTVSGKHAEIRLVDGQLVLHDLNSTNGTYVDGARLQGSTTIHANSLVQFADLAFRVQEQQNQSLANTRHEDVYDQALALVQFDRLMNERAVVPYYQPIVDLGNNAVVGYEVLGRSRILGLESVQKMFAAATQLSLEVELSRMLRWEGLQAAEVIPTTPNLYVNTHPEELKKDGLIQSMASLRHAYPEQEITLEIHESAISEPSQMIQLRQALLDMDVRLAFDDFGAGQARLVELAEVKPDVLKFDMGLIRGIDQATNERQQMLEMLVKISQDFGTTPLAEGIETSGEGDFCRKIGFKLAQGYLYGRPAPAKFYDG